MIVAMLHCALFVFLFMNALFVLSLYKKNTTVADLCWGIGFIVIAVYTFLAFSSFTQRQLLVTLCVLLWGVRLSAHIYLRNRGKGEDARYRRWRLLWGDQFAVRSYVQLFMTQGVVMLFVSAPIILINSTTVPVEMSLFDLFGFAVWITGLFFESVADYQLYLFLQDPSRRGKIMMQGLWRYSRHPNYFGETVVWWGLFFMAVQLPYGWLTIVSPLMISYILLYVSGVPLAEKQMEGLAEFAEYQKRTAIFVPWFVKKGQ